MSRQIDRFFLIALSTALYYLADGRIHILIPTAVTVILCILSFLIKNPVFQCFTFIGFLTLCIPLPLFSIFLPVFFYDLLQTVFRWMIILFPVVIFFIWERLPFSIFFLNCFFLLLSFLLAKKQEAVEIVSQDYEAFRKTSQELTQAQEEKSRSLLENQDYEIRTATLKERNRISREIHDHVGHVLSRSLLQIGALMTLEKDPVILEGLSDLKTSISEGMDSIRTTIHDIHDESIDLKTGLEELICDFSFCPAKLTYELSFQPQIKLRYCFLALVKESLTNVIKHSNATEVSVLLKEETEQYCLEIFDNGSLTPENKLKLIKAQARNEYSDGLGLQSMYDRVRSFHGSFQLNLENGFKLTAIIPKEDTEDENITD